MTGPKAASHTGATLHTWRRVRDLRAGAAGVVLDGTSLDVAAVVAVARHGVLPALRADAARLDASVAALAACLARDWVVYGVNTGFGGSADCRTARLVDLQMHLLQHTQSAIVAAADRLPPDRLPAGPPAAAPSVMPAAWVRAAIVARANQNLRGHSAVRLAVLERLVDLVRHDLTPLVPLRGSISASGDLMPMSYIAGAVTGNPDVLVRVGPGPGSGPGPGALMPAPDALRRCGLAPAGLGPKEALGLINGTAPSVAAASLVLHDAQQLALLAQLLTALAAEAMGGNVEWALPFVHAVRPHPGQVEAAANIRRFLRRSALVVGLESRRRTGDGLWQDRYSLRTAPQWLGPYLEDLLLAQRQLEVELNSTSDNPLVDPESAVPGSGDEPPVADVYSGGNFQATAVTSAMDKTRLALQMIGRMLFSQVTEMIGPATNNGLEANLNASEHENFTMKGIDVNAAAYMSELAALAHPVSAHVMSAEMHNQGINSLALLSARRTAEAADLVAHLCACHIYVACQAVDLRANHARLAAALRETVLPAVVDAAGLVGEPAAADGGARQRLVERLAPAVESAWYRNNTGTWRDRVPHAAEAAVPAATEFLAAEGRECSVARLAAFRAALERAVAEAAASMLPPGPTMESAAVATHMGEGTSRLYLWLRSRLGVPLHRGIADDPLYTARQGLPPEGKKTIGSWVSIVYDSIIDGGAMDVVSDVLA